MSTVNYFDVLEAQTSYHVYNRTNNKELLFKCEEDRIFFMDKYKLYLTPFVDTYAYCFMDNHFHFVIGTKSLYEILNVIKAIPPKELIIAQRKFLALPSHQRTVYKVLERQFTRLFTSYATYINDKYDREGNLFNRPFKRLIVDNDTHFAKLIYYVHRNPKHHHVLDDFTKYRWSSYQTYLSKSPTLIKREAILDWYGGIEGFIQFHGVEQDFDGMEDLLIED